MSTKIEWVKNPDGTPGETLNPIRGKKSLWYCTKVSPGCKNCFSEGMSVRFYNSRFGKNTDEFRLDKKPLEQIKKWKSPKTVFMCDMTDIFHEGISDDIRFAVFEAMAAAKQHKFLILTKRPEIMACGIDSIVSRIAKKYPDNIGRGNRNLRGITKNYIKNVGFGISTENQHYADERIPKLMLVESSFWFVSAEPLLGEINFTKYVNGGLKDGGSNTKLDWIISGGESGVKARATNPYWHGNIRDVCFGYGVPFVFKQ